MQHFGTGICMLVTALGIPYGWMLGLMSEEPVGAMYRKFAGEANLGYGKKRGGGGGAILGDGKKRGGGQFEEHSSY